MESRRFLEASVQAIQHCPRAGQSSVIVAPRSDWVASDNCRKVLTITIGRAAAHLLTHELRKEGTSRAEGLELATRIAAELGGRLSGVYVEGYAPDLARTSIEIATGERRIDIPVEPGLALAASVWLGLPLYVDKTLLDPAAPGPAPFTGPIAEFIETLHLGDL